MTCGSRFYGTRLVVGGGSADNPWLVMVLPHDRWGTRYWTYLSVLEMVTCVQCARGQGADGAAVGTEKDGYDRTLCIVVLTCGVILFRSTHVSERRRVRCGESGCSGHC
ncbi:hypothetical protein GQ55_6G233300 [Panicum hallii var. hallii]|uniref:Uncharacterized protein n=1 Tax=Panicum hallii var. hallii TaxID=1504633 RepID=A0A2T7D8V8_9POAL|nr:hypothetical protein GQ55_6G233300 [Panicum hallii var. hallii]